MQLILRVLEKVGFFKHLAFNEPRLYKVYIVVKIEYGGCHWVDFN